MITLSISDLILASSFLLFHALLSILLQLGLVKSLIISTIRMIIQLSLMAIVLQWLFTQLSLLWTAIAAVIMVLVAGYEIQARQQYSLKTFWNYGMGSVTMLFVSSIVTIFALTTQIKAQPWYDPRYALPLLGMILGNTMTGISLGLHSLYEAISREKNAIEAKLCLGYNFWHSLLPIIQQALRTALIPILNTMATTGLVSIPGMMTGQILAGAQVNTAVNYQILILFLIAGATALGALMAIITVIVFLTDQRQRLRLDRLQRRKL